MQTTISIYSILWFFLIYSFVGWCLEVVFCSANTGQFVNRGFLNGPVCPIYGFGGVAIILLLTPLQHNLLVLYLASVLVTSLLELVAGFVLKKLFHTSWWDYSDEPFNLGGYICLKFSLAWGIAGVFLMRVLQPGVSGLVHLLPHTLGVVLLAVFYGVFLADAIVTVNVILKLNRDLGEITRIAKGLHEGSETIAKSLGNRAISVSEKIGELDLEQGRTRLTEMLSEGKESAAHKLDEKREKITEKFEIPRERLEQLLGRHSFTRRRLLNAFPRMENKQYTQAFERLRELYPSRRRRNENVPDSGAVKNDPDKKS